VEAGIPTKFSAGPDPRFNTKYQTPQEKLEEYKKDNPDIGGTAHNKTDRQLYIGNLPPEIKIPELCKHLNDALYALNLCEKEDKPIVDAWISGDGHYGFVEFRTIKDAHLGFNLSQISIHGHALKVGKPKIANSTYHLMQQQLAQNNHNIDDAIKVTHQPIGQFINPQTIMQNSAAINNQFDNILKSLPGPAGHIPPTSNPTSFMNKVHTVTKLKVSNLPLEYSEGQIREILNICGAIKELELINDENTGKYKGEVFVQYEKEEDSRKAEAALMGMKILDAYLHVKKVQTTTTLQDSDSKLWKEEWAPCTWLALSNLLIPEQVSDPNEYADVEDEVYEEMETYGKVLQVVAPRPDANYRPGQTLEPGIGRVFVRFNNEREATVAKTAMQGRRFEGRIVEARYYPEDEFSKGAYNYYA